MAPPLYEKCWEIQHKFWLVLFFLFCLIYIVISTQMTFFLSLKLTNKKLLFLVHYWHILQISELFLGLVLFSKG